MGCWNETCMITNLPITYNEKVVLFILKEDQFNTLKPISLPIVGLYNDYGQLKEGTIEQADMHINFFKNNPFFNEYKSIYEIIKDIERENIEHVEDYYLGFVLKDVFDTLVQYSNDRSKHYKRDLLIKNVQDVINLKIEIFRPKLGLVIFEEDMEKDNIERDNVFLDLMKGINSPVYQMRETVLNSLFKDKNEEMIESLIDFILFDNALFYSRKLYISYKEFSGSSTENYDLHQLLAESVSNHIEKRKK